MEAPLPPEGPLPLPEVVVVVWEWDAEQMVCRMGWMAMMMMTMTKEGGGV